MSLDVWALADAGSAVPDEIVFREMLLGVRTTGRSPPAAL